MVIVQFSSATVLVLTGQAKVFDTAKEKGGRFPAPR
jgi:hypothetical protein